MRRYCIPTALALSLLLNVGVVVGVGFHFFEDSASSQASEELDAMVSLADYLQLSEEQLPEWQRREEVFLASLNAVLAEIRTHREKMLREVLSDDPDSRVVEKERSAVLTLLRQQQQQVLAQLTEERKMLNTEQRQALVHLLVEQHKGCSMEKLPGHIHNH